MSDSFDSWLGVRLKELEADEVFGPYIRTILEGDESPEDKSDSLEDMLAGLGLEDVQDFKGQVRKNTIVNTLRSDSCGRTELSCLRSQVQIPRPLSPTSSIFAALSCDDCYGSQRYSSYHQPSEKVISLLSQSLVLYGKWINNL